MLPVVNSIYLPTQAPLVNTVTPGTTITHVPYDNVAPSVSSAQTDPNARGNSSYISIQEEAPAAAQSESEQIVSASRLTGGAPGAPATFLAQLIAQGSGETAAILAQYEKMVAYSNVKYKPSNAFKPPAEPLGVFGHLLQQAHAQPAPAVVKAAPHPAAHAVQAATPAPAAPRPAPANPGIALRSLRTIAASSYAASVQRTEALTRQKETAASVPESNAPVAEHVDELIS